MLLPSFGRALLAQCHPKIWLMSLLPMLGAIVLWSVLLYFTLPPIIDHFQQLFTTQNSFRSAGAWLAVAGIAALKVVVVPLLTLWVILPLIMLSTLLLVGAVLMPMIIHFVSSRDFPALEKKAGGTFIGGVANSFRMFGVFVLIWLLCLPLGAIPPLALLAHTVLWGWLTYRVMIYDALADHATLEEQQAIIHQHRWHLLLIGIITSLIGNLATMLWLSGAIAMLFLPVTSILAIWLYFVTFIFSGLWFQYFSFAALQTHREQGTQRLAAA